MMRYLRGTVVLGILALVGACNSEPSDLEGGVPDRIVVDPQTVFLNQGASQALLIRVEDDQGSSLNEPITISNISAGISVEPDSGFRPVYNADGDLVFNEYSTELRVFVTGEGLTAGSFTVSGGGISEDVSVTVLPNTIDVTFSDAAPDIGELVTATAPAGITFNPNTTIEFAAGEPANIVSITDTEIQFYVAPGSSGEITFTDVTPSYAPGLSLSFPASSEIEHTNVTLVSSEDPNTAPTVASGLAVDETVVVYDLAYAVDQFYHIEITEANTVIDIEFDWAGGADVDFWLCDAACSNPGNPGGFGAATGAHPEHLVVTFPTPGIYTLQANLYSGSQDAWYKLTLHRTE